MLFKTMKLSIEKKIMDLEKRLVIAKGGGRERDGLGTIQTIAFGMD